MKRIDFERAKLLLDIIATGQTHGAVAQRLAGYANEELKQMVDFAEKEDQPKVVTPPAGPANSAVQNPDGTIRPLVPPRQQSSEDQPPPNRPPIPSQAPRSIPSNEAPAAPLPSPDEIDRRV